MKLYNKYWKRVFDFCLSFIGLLFLLPFFLLITIIIKLTDKGSAFFSQMRIGQNFRPFKIYKFRSMISDAQNVGPSVTSNDDLRITPIGRFLRKTKLDELPQLFNVLKGDMSLVGPRPEVDKFVKVAKNDYKTVLSVKPGITDYAAIEYRDEEKVMEQFENKEKAYIEEVLPIKIKLYKKYIYDMGFITDFKVIFSTILKILPLDISLIKPVNQTSTTPINHLSINPLTKLPINSAPRYSIDSVNIFSTNNQIRNKYMYLPKEFNKNSDYDNPFELHEIIKTYQSTSRNKEES